MQIKYKLLNIDKFIGFQISVRRSGENTNPLVFSRISAPGLSMDTTIYSVEPIFYTKSSLVFSIPFPRDFIWTTATRAVIKQSVLWLVCLKLAGSNFSTSGLLDIRLFNGKKLCRFNNKRVP